MCYKSFKLVKIKSTNKSDLFLISLVRISDSCIALFNWRFLISFKTLFLFQWMILGWFPCI